MTTNIIDSDPNTNEIMGRLYECRQNRWSRIQFYYDTESYSPVLPTKTEKETMELLGRIATDLMHEGEMIIHSSGMKPKDDRPARIAIMFKWSS